MSLNATNSTCDRFQLSLPVKIFNIIALLAIFFISLVGNTSIIIVVHKRSELKKTMNYFIVNMAVSDFVVPITALAETLQSTFWQWPTGSIATLILYKIQTFLMSISVAVSIQSLVWMTIDRFVAVVWPLKFHLISPRVRRIAIGSTWIVASLMNGVDLYSVTIKDRDGKMTCDEEPQSLAPIKALNYLRVILFFISPIILMIVLYSAIAVALRKQDKVRRGIAAQNTNQKKTNQAIKMSLCVVLLYLLCVFPFSIIVMFLPTPFSRTCLFKHLLRFFGLLLTLSSATNPIICFTFMASYRSGLKDIFSFLQPCKRVNPSTIEAGDMQEMAVQNIAKLQPGIGNIH